MNQKLWELIQELADKSQIGTAELAVAGANLDPEVSSVFNKHMSKGDVVNAPIEWA
ncbi:hypothetical protein ABWW58_08715 [Sporolactobacillus sp. STCC-11]|uniref:hypothetical protein n=1 Tax=Sporolactobacillus caesalpiniae TaxID=3230362 RepID=UPI003396D679